MNDKYDNPRCTCGPLIHRVTNLAEGVELTIDMGHRSAWVCEKRACILDAMAWVERGTGEPALVYTRDHKLVTL